MKCRGQCAMISGMCVPDTLGCEWLKINDASWLMGRIDLDVTDTSWEACLAAVTSSEVCDTSVVQYDRDEEACKCVDINGATGHVAPGDSDLYYCFPKSDCVWKADYTDQWCSNRINLSYADGATKDMATCKSMIDADDRCSKTWMQTDHGRTRCKCLPMNQNCVFNNGDSNLLHCYNNQVFDCDNQGAMVISSTVYVSKFNFNVDFRLFMSVTVDVLQVTDAAIFEARDGTSNIRLDVTYMATSGKLVVSTCATEARRRLCVDCVDPPPCTMVVEYSVTKGVEYDLTIKFTGGKVVVMIGLSSQNTVTVLGGAAVLGAVVNQQTTSIGFGHDSSVLVCGNEDGLTFKGTVKSLDYRTDWTP
jgi:hypothetical protein